ncbi:MAG: transposase [Chloroflexota bacterium]|nr:transposase [Chloroflexota bacterium]
MFKDRIRQERGLPSADLVNKGERDVTEAGGEVVRKQIRYNGYKTHVSMDTESRMVTAMKTTPGLGNEADCNQMVALMNLDKATGLSVNTYAADRGYDDGGLREELKERGQHDAIKLRRFRTTKKDANKERWLKLQVDPHYQEGLSQRYTIEAKFGEAKAWHGFGRSHSLGQTGHIAQAFLTAMVLHLKRVVLIVTGVPCRETSRKRLVTSHGSPGSRRSECACGAAKPGGRGSVQTLN